jgi:hypothetical protein
MTDKKDWCKTDSNFKKFLEDKKNAEKRQYNVNECTNCGSTDVRSLATVFVDTEGCSTTRRLCKQCVIKRSDL